MSEIQNNPKTLSNPNKTVALVVSQFNERITGPMKQSCIEELKRSGMPEENISIVEVPGAFEIPFMCQRVIAEKKPNAVITLGCIIKGETDHFDFIAQAAANGIMQVSLKTNIPVIFGVITPNNLEQAKARINKGKEVAQAAVQILNTKIK